MGSGQSLLYPLGHFNHMFPLVFMVTVDDQYLWVRSMRMGGKQKAKGQQKENLRPQCLVTDVVHGIPQVMSGLGTGTVDEIIQFSCSHRNLIIATPPGKNKRLRLLIAMTAGEKQYLLFCLGCKKKTFFVPSFFLFCKCSNYSYIFRLLSSFASCLP
jgi:hypothetical protein